VGGPRRAKIAAALPALPCADPVKGPTLQDNNSQQNSPSIKTANFMTHINFPTDNEIGDLTLSTALYISNKQRAMAKPTIIEETTPHNPIGVVTAQGNGRQRGGGGNWGEDIGPK